MQIILAVLAVCLAVFSRDLDSYLATLVLLVAGMMAIAIVFHELGKPKWAEPRRRDHRKP